MLLKLCDCHEFSDSHNGLLNDCESDDESDDESDCESDDNGHSSLHSLFFRSLNMNSADTE